MPRQTDAPDEALIRSLRSGKGSAPTLIRSIQKMRASSAEQSRKIDETLITEYRHLQDTFNEMRDHQQALRSMVESAMSPPWYPVVFLELTETACGVWAKVVDGSTQKLVRIADDVDASDLQRGDEVCLSEQHNLLVYKDAAARPSHGGVAKVERLLDDDRISITDRGAHYVVALSEQLRETELTIGDSVRWSEQAMLAIEKVPGEDSAGEFLVEEVVDTPASLLGGMNQVRDRTVGRFVKHIAHPDVASDYGITFANRRLMLAGPPGCGKTLLARVIASEIKKETGKPVRLATVSGSTILDPYVGQTEKNISALFRIPPGFDGVSVIFFDEIDTIGRGRGDGANAHADRFLGTLLAEMEGYESRPDVVVIGATNRVDMLDAALLERFAYRLRVERPNRAAAREIFDIHLPKDLPLRPNGDARDATLQTMIETAVARLYDDNADNQVAVLRFRDGRSQTVYARELLSGRLIEQISLEARQQGFERHIAGGAEGIAVGDMQAAVSDAICRLGDTLSINNVHCHLTTLSTDTEVVAVEPATRRVNADAYLRQDNHAS